MIVAVVVIQTGRDSQMKQTNSPVLLKYFVVTMQWPYMIGTFRVFVVFDLGKLRIYRHSWKERLTRSKIVKLVAKCWVKYWKLIALHAKSANYVCIVLFYVQELMYSFVLFVQELAKRLNRKWTKCILNSLLVLLRQGVCEQKYFICSEKCRRIYSIMNTLI